MRFFIPAAAAVALAVAPLGAADKYEAKAEKVAPPKELKPAFAELLGDDAVQVSNGGKSVATIWLRKEVPAKATPEQVKNGLTYREVQPTTVVGAVKFDQTWKDFRKQEVPAGVYVLRLALQPQDGDHMGTAPYNEFCLLTPAGEDEKPDPMGLKNLYELSAKSNGGSHPSVMLLFPNSKPEDAPKVADKGAGVWVLNWKRPVAAGDQKGSLGFGLVVAGVTTAE
jgi:hypothetical protein